MLFVFSIRNRYSEPAGSTLTCMFSLLHVRTLPSSFVEPITPNVSCRSTTSRSQSESPKPPDIVATRFTSMGKPISFISLLGF